MALISIATNGSGELWAGTGNPASGFVEIETANLELALAARPTLNGQSYNASAINGVTHFAVPASGADIRFLYSVASPAHSLDGFVIKLKMDLDPGAGVNFKTFLLHSAPSGALGNGSGRTWVWDQNNNGTLEGSELQALGVTPGAYIRDDTGNTAKPGQVTQNIENLAWFDADAGAAIMTKGSYTITLEAQNRAGSAAPITNLTNTIVLDVAGGALKSEEKVVNLLGVATNGANIWAGTGNPASGFITKEAVDVAGKILQLGLTARETQVGVGYTSTQSGDATRFAISEASDKIRFAYSVASDGATLDKFDIKLKMDVDASAGTNFKTFILTPEISSGSGFAWILDANGNGSIETGEKVGLIAGSKDGTYIGDDAGNGASQVSQNIMNLSWFDGIAGNDLVKGSYDIVLQAFDKGSTTAAIENRIVLDVAGGAPTGGGGGGGGSTPPVTPGPKPFVPPVVSDPSPNDGFNEGKAVASVATFFTGVAPTPEKQAALNTFANMQFEAYKAAGVANPAMGPYEALGRGFAETIEFATKYSSVSEADFIAARYLEVFGRAPSAAQQAHFQAQIDYFEKIYENAGISSAQADLLAKGAALGQMIGHLALDGPGGTSLVGTSGKSMSDAGWDLAA